MYAILLLLATFATVKYDVRNLFSLLAGASCSRFLVG